MKLLHVSGSTDIGGAERVLLRIAQGIRRTRPDWEVDALVLCRYGTGGLAEEYQKTYRTVFPGTPLYEDSHHRIIDLCKTFGYNVVHCIDSFHLTRMAAQWLSPYVRFVQNVFPNVAKSPHGPKQEWLDNPSLPYAALVTEFAANTERLPKLPNGEVLTIPNGIDVDFWTPAPTSYQFQRDIDVTWCARTDPEKGIDAAMELVPLLCEKGLQYRIITSEPDGPREKLHRIKQLWPANFAWYSALTPSQLRNVFRHTKVFLSTSTVEGMPATPLEAAACGCEPLVPEIDGLSEAFGDRPEFTYSSPDHNAPNLAAVIHGIVRTLSPTSIGLSAVAREIACRYSLDAMVNNYVKLYERIIRHIPTE